MKTVATSPQRILATLQAYRDAAALNTAIELDLFTTIGQGADNPGKIASSIGVPVHGVRLLCEYWAGAGLLIKEDQQFRLSEEAAKFLDSRSPAYVGDAARVLCGPQLWRAYEKLTESVRAGLPPNGDKAKIGARPDWFHLASGVADSTKRVQAFTDAAKLPEDQPLKILSIGDDNGALGIGLALRYPRSVVVGLDSPEGIAAAHKRAEAAKLGTRYQNIPGDALESPLGSAYDAVVIADLYQFTPAQIMSLLMRMNYALKKAGQLFILEFLSDDSDEFQRASAPLRLNLLAATNKGDTCSLAEVKEMLQSTGFQSIQVLNLPAACATLLTAHS